MDYILFGAIVLLCLLCIGFKEGYYSDSNITTSIASMGTLIHKLNSLTDSIKNIEEYDLTFDAQSKLSPILQPKKMADYKPGVIQQVHIHSERMSLHQDNLINLLEGLHKVKETPVYLKEKDKSADTDTSTNSWANTTPDSNVPNYISVKYTLNDAIDKLLKESQSISNELNKIPDS